MNYNDFKCLLDVIDDRTNKLPETYSGTVTSVVVGNKRANVKLSGYDTEFNFLNKSKETLSIGDGVLIRAINGNLSNAYIEIRYGEST